MMSLGLSSASSSTTLFCKSLNYNTTTTKLSAPRFTVSAAAAASSSSSSSDVPDFLSVDWLESRRKRPFGPRLSFNAEECVQYQLDALMFNDQPRPDYGVEVMYRFAGFDPFERSLYFGPSFDLGQFERFRRLFHHSSYRVLLNHKERKILSTLNVEENRYRQRVWIRGARPEEEETFQFTMVQIMLFIANGENLSKRFAYGQIGELEDDSIRKKSSIFCNI